MPIEEGLFPEEDAPVLRTAAQEVLRTLIDEVPAKMAEAEQICRFHVSVGSEDRRFRTWNGVRCLQRVSLALNFVLIEPFG